MKNVAVKCVVIKAQEMNKEIADKLDKLDTTGAHYLQLETGEFAVVSKKFFEKAFQFMDLKKEESK